MSKLHIKKGDLVEVISGVSKGSRGKVLEASPADQQVIIEGASCFQACKAQKRAAGGRNRQGSRSCPRM